MPGPDSRQAILSRTGLSSLRVGKLDQALDLRDGKGWKAFMQFFDALAEVVAVHDGVRQNTGATYDGPPGDLAGNPLNQFTGCPIDLCPRLGYVSSLSLS